VKPAFASPSLAAAFAACLATLVALPALVSRTSLLSRRDVYPAIPAKYGPFPWIQREIFGETKDVDVAFLGSSQIWCAIDTPFVKEKLGAALGREAEVFTLGWPWPGFDALYVIARDLLDHRRVRMLVVYDEDRGDGSPHVHASRWFLAGDAEVVAGLPWLDRARLYGSAVLGMPRHLLSLVRADELEDPALGPPNFWNTYYHAPHVAQRLGSLRARLAYGVSPDFTRFDGHSDATAADAVVYGPGTRDAFTFSGSPGHPYQLAFFRKLAALCRARGVRLVVLHTPALHERGLTQIPERFAWPDVLGVPVDMLGIPPARLFAGLSAEDITKLFYEDGHFNENGQDLFTPLITPALVRLHGDAAAR